MYSSCNFLHPPAFLSIFGPNILSQHPVYKHPEFTFLPLVRGVVSLPYKTSGGKDTGSILKFAKYGHRSFVKKSQKGSGTVAGLET
jgi:hypothetical protein